MTRDLGLDDARDRQMHDTFDPDPHPFEGTFAKLGDPEPADAPEQPQAPRKRDWHNVGTRVRTVRLSDALWAAVQTEAELAGITTSTLVRDALHEYLDRRP